MAFALKGAGSASTDWSVTANQSSFVLTTSTTAGAANDLAVLLYAVDNNQTTDGDEVAVTGVTDSAGNFWQKAVEFTNGQGTAQTGATNGIWFCNLQNALAIGATVTLAFSNNTSRDAAAVSLTYFTKAAGFKAAVEGTPGTLANDAAAAGSLSVTTANIACLRIRAIASESSTTTALTKTAAFTAVLTQAISTGGASAGNQGVRGEYLISTGTGTASAPTGGAGAVDNASVYVAFREDAFFVGDPPHNSDQVAGAQVATIARKAVTAALITASAGLFQTPYPRGNDPALTAGVPVTTGSTAPRARKVYYQAAFITPYVAPAAATPAPQGWQAPLSGAPAVAKAQPGFSFVPLDTQQISAAPGIPLNMGDAAPSVRPVYYQSRFETPYLPPVGSNGWQAQLSVAIQVAPPSQDFGSVPFATFAAPSVQWQPPLSGAPAVSKPQAGYASVPYNTAQLSVNFTNFGWHQPLSTASPVAKAQPGYAFVPFNTAQLAVNYTDFDWYQPLSGAPDIRQAPPGVITGPFSPASTVTLDWQPPFSVAPVVKRVIDSNTQLPVYPGVVVIDNTVTLDKWQVPLSVAPPVARARQGDSFVPYNTAQVVVGAYTNFWLQPLSVAVAVARAVPDFGSLPYFTPAVVTVTWQSPLSTTPAVAKAPVGFSYVPFNTAQLAVNYTDFSWYQALSVVPSVAKARLADWSLPYTIVNAVGVAWQPALSAASTIAKAPQGFAAVPFYPAQPVAGIAGMAWFTPLWTVPTRMLTAPQGNSFVPFNTQQIVVTTPGQRRPTLFIANVGRLMNH